MGVDTRETCCVLNIEIDVGGGRFCLALMLKPMFEKCLKSWYRTKCLNTAGRSTKRQEDRLPGHGKHLAWGDPVDSWNAQGKACKAASPGL